MPWAGPAVAGTRAAGGAEGQILMLGRGLAAGGLRVGLLVIGERSSLPREVDGVDVLTLPSTPRLRGVAGFVHDVTTMWALLRTPARVIVQRNAGRTAAVAACAARLRRSRFVYSAAGVLDFQQELVATGYNARLFAWGVRAAAEVVVQTDEQARLCRERFDREPVVIRSIAEPAAPRRGVPQAFLWAARLTPNKRLDVYLDLAAAVPEARFQVIATPHPDDGHDPVARLERAEAQLPNLEVLEPRPRKALADLVERAVAVVNTSQYEGMPNLFLEGWARGVPALAFSYDPDGVVVRHGLGGFAAGSQQRLAEVARAQWMSREHQREVAERCIAYVRNHHRLDAACAAWRTVLGT